MSGTCASCRHYRAERAVIEQRVAGLQVLGSAYGASLGESGLCERHDRLAAPADRCGWHAAVGSAGGHSSSDEAAASPFNS